MCFFFQAEDGIRDLVRSRGLGDVYKRQGHMRRFIIPCALFALPLLAQAENLHLSDLKSQNAVCLLYTSDAADERSSVDLGGRRIIKKKTNTTIAETQHKLTHRYRDIEKITDRRSSIFKTKQRTE